MEKDYAQIIPPELFCLYHATDPRCRYGLPISVIHFALTNTHLLAHRRSVRIVQHKVIIDGSRTTWCNQSSVIPTVARIIIVHVNNRLCASTAGVVSYRSAWGRQSAYDLVFTHVVTGCSTGAPILNVNKHLFELLVVQMRRCTINCSVCSPDD